MGRYVEGDNVVILAVELEVSQVVAVIAIEDKEATNPSYSSFSVLIEVLNPFQASLVGCLTVFRCYNDLVLRQ